MKTAALEPQIEVLRSRDYLMQRPATCRRGTHNMSNIDRHVVSTIGGRIEHHVSLWRCNWCGRLERWTETLPL